MRKSLLITLVLVAVVIPSVAKESFPGIQIPSPVKQVRDDIDAPSLVLNQGWVPYPAYADRQGWDAFLGEYQPVLTARGECYGEIAREERGRGGFGYDPLFRLPDGRHMAELSSEEKNRISHRGNALRELKRILTEQREL